MKTLFITFSIMMLGLAQGGATWRLSESRKAEERDKLWREDLNQLADTLPKNHINLFFKIKEADFRKSVEDLDKKTSKLNDDQVLVELMKLVASAGDAHTTVRWYESSVGLHNYPIGAAWFDDGIYVHSAAQHYEIIGSKITKMGGIGIDEVLRRIASVFPYENDATLKSFSMQYLFVAEILYGLGIAPDARKINIEFESDGKKSSAEFELPAPGVRPAAKSFYETKKVAPPFRRKKNGAYWSDLIPDTRILYIQYNDCTDYKDMPMAVFAKKVEDFIESLKIEKVVVDLRNNGGGNSQVAQPLIEVLTNNANINKKGKLFVLIGRGTFSSAQLNAYDFRKRTAAVLVGEPTGQKPNAYGEQKSFILTNSKLGISYSTKAFVTSEVDEPSMRPDVAINVSSAQFFAGADPVLDAIVSGAIPVK
ncbi:MAG: hypothetical protein HY286_04845 [Planctomycetes bacterium]|nr:hypothetical protein [Planctomycetota bacterium]